MKKTVLFLLLAVFGCLAVGAQTVVTKNMAVSFARQNFGNTNDFDYYIGETRHDFSTNPLTFGRLEDCWLVFIDKRPNSGWEHPCTYFYVKKTYKTNDINFISVKDSVCPPADVFLEPYNKINRYGTKAKMKPYVPKVQSNSPNVAAGNTYAVIVNGGMTVTANHERYWNDCSFLYKTLRNRYGIPKQNIKVLMSDGTSDDEDMNLTGGGYVSSPLDLDDDGNPDIEYAATKANLSTVLNDMAQKLTDEDHLFLFVMDHGGYDKVSKRSYIYMWNHEKMYPNELASYLNPINAGYISMLFGQCNAGGFIEPLKKTNRIITTACKETELSYGCEEIPFDEFVYHWTSAVNGYDAYGNAVAYRANGSMYDSDRSLKRAAEYAYKKDFYVNGESRYAHETPLVNYLTNTNITDLRFDNIPPVIDLYFEYSDDDIVSELKTQEPKEYGIQAVDISGNSYSAILNRNRFWACPNIWIRNQDDGRTHLYSETPRIINELGVEVYIYAKVRNRGVKSYATKNGYQDVNGYYMESAVLITAGNWYGLLSGSKGGNIEGISIENDIEPGQSTIVDLYHAIRRVPPGNRKDKFYPMCFLLYLEDPNSEYIMPIDSLDIVEVWGTDKMAQSNEIFGKTTSIGLCSVFLHNPYNKLVNYTIKINPKEKSNVVFKEAKVSLSMTPSLMASWEKGGSLGIDVEADKNVANRICLKDSGCVLRNIKLNKHEGGYIAFNCNYLAQNAITSDKRTEFDVMVVDEATGRVLGGETFVITQDARPAINPDIEIRQNGSDVLLEAINVSEDVVYEWYDKDGILVGKGQTFKMPAGSSKSDYTVRVEARTDGAISYSKAVAPVLSSIKSVDARSRKDAVIVTFDRPTAGQVTLRVASSSGNMPISDYTVPGSVTTYDIPSAGMSSGIYQVTLVVDGQVTGMKKFTK